MLSSRQPIEQFQHTCCGLTDTGRIRDNNEDCFTLCPETGFYLLADGMGGHLGGEVASRLAVDEVVAGMAEMGVPQIAADESNCLKAYMAAFARANSAVVNMGRKDPALAGMGCTLICCLIYGYHAHLCHVGDVRGYHLRGDKLEQIGTDHSLVAEQVGESEEEVANNIITRCIGVPASPGPDYNHVPLKGKDQILICSDGLWNMVSDEEIQEILMQESDGCHETCEALIDAANSAGGNDNVTVVLIQGE